MPRDDRYGNSMSSSSAAARRARPPRRCSPSRASASRCSSASAFPRFHIGESLIPETYWVLKRLNMLPKMQQQPLRQEVQRPVRQRRRQAVGAVLLLGQQAARVLADLAGGAQRVRQDDARQRARARRRRPRRRRASLDVLFEGDRAVGVTVQNGDGPRRTCAPGGRRRQRPERAAAEPLPPARLGSGARTRARSGPTGRAPIATPARTKARRWCCRPPTSTAGSGTSRCTTTSSASASWRRPKQLFKGRGTREQIYTEEVEQCPGGQAAHGGRDPRHRLLRHQGLLVPRRRRPPATAGC